MIDLLNYFKRKKFFEGLMTNYGGNEADGAEALRHPSEDTSFFRWIITPDYW